MSDEGLFEEAEIDLTNAGPGSEVVPAPVGPTAVQASMIPDKLTLDWVNAQVPAKVWKKNGYLNPHLVVEMHKMARKGMTPSVIAARCGVHMNTWTKWARKAAAGEEPYATWYRCMLVGSADIQEEQIANIRAAATSDWKAAAWLLGKLNRDDFGDGKTGQNVTNVHVEGDAVEKKETKTVSTIDEDAAQRIATIMGKIGAIPSNNVVDAEVVEDE